MSKYYVALMVLYSDEVEANSPEEAADIVMDNCPYDMDTPPMVTDLETGETIEVF